MKITIRKFIDSDLPSMVEIWNEVVRAKNAFPQIEELALDQAKTFFANQSYSAVAIDEANNILGLYILHPNNIGRCGHIANASYAVKSNCRGLHIGEKLVLDSLNQGYILGFKVLQFNAVVATNIHARHLYERLGFISLGTIKNGYKVDENTYLDICPYYHELTKKNN